jgi:hypothetical protein
VAWRRLYDRVKASKERFLGDLAKRLMGGDTVTSEEIAYHRGFYQGAFYVLAHPEVAEKNLERAARMAYMLAQEEMESEEAPPYE